MSIGTNQQRRFWKRWGRPTFTIRTVAIFVTVVCAYYGAWARKRYGVRDVVQHRLSRMEDPMAVAWHRQHLAAGANVNIPFVVVVDPNGVPPAAHFWFFGYVAGISMTARSEYAD